MKYSININQKAAIDLELKADLTDLAVLDFFTSFVHSGQCKVKEIEGRIFYWIKWKLISDQMPLLRIKSRQGMTKRINNLISDGLLDRFEDNQKKGVSWFAFGEKYEKYTFSQPDNNSLQVAQNLTTTVTKPDNNSLQVPDNDRLHRKEYKEYNTIKEKEKAETTVSSPTKKEKQVDHFTAPEFDGLKKKIGPKHYQLLNEIHETPGMKEKLIKLWKDKTFGILMDFLEHRKEIGKTFPTKKGIVDLINSEFHEYTPEELAAGLKKAIKGTHQGLYPNKIQTPKPTHKEPENYDIINRIHVQRGGFNLPTQKIAS